MPVRSTAASLLLIFSKTTTVYHSVNDSFFENTTNKQSVEPKWEKEKEKEGGRITKYSGLDYTFKSSKVTSIM